ncbi:MAG: hypothetical protein ACRC14_20090, partial [Paracoccaceae bacterium]
MTGRPGLVGPTGLVDEGVRDVAQDGAGMTRNGVIGVLLGAVFLAQPGFAASLAEEIAQKLRGQGFSGVQVERTLLGRERITGARGGG